MLQQIVEVLTKNNFKVTPSLTNEPIVGTVYVEMGTMRYNAATFGTQEWERNVILRIRTHSHPEAVDKATQIAELLRNNFDTLFVVDVSFKNNEAIITATFKEHAV